MNNEYSENQTYLHKKYASDITEFWHTIEFLNQTVFPKESRENKTKVRKEEESLVLMKDTKPCPSFSLYHKLNSETVIQEIIEFDDKKFVRHTVERRSLLRSNSTQISAHRVSITA